MATLSYVLVQAAERLHIADELTRFEKAGEPRNQQPDILISCFSGLSWKFALIAYDGIRTTTHSRLRAE